MPDLKPRDNPSWSFWGDVPFFVSSGAEDLLQRSDPQSAAAPDARG
jgi:hypothetical protein